MRLKSFFQGLGIISFLFGLPLFGAMLAGFPALRYLEFPPLTRYVEHAPYSWTVFWLTGLIGLSITAFLWFLYWPFTRNKNLDLSRRSFPIWGWCSLASMAGLWLLAWNRFPWFASWQFITFTGLWLSYILLANALAYWRRGSCYAIKRPHELIALFPASALFWWYFEYLNRFVQNWHYLGIEGYSAGRYVLQSTLAFSTVLPAVISTLELMKTFPALGQTRRHLGLDVRISRNGARVLLGFSSLGLMGLGMRPDYLFPVVWILPAFIVLSLLVVYRRESILSNLAQGDWHEASLAMLAALVCGFFWEMWNYRSAPKWVYSVPFVDSFHLFEMPLLGYLGYLPFGLECLVVADQVKRWVSSTKR